MEVYTIKLFIRAVVAFLLLLSKLVSDLVSCKLLLILRTGAEFNVIVYLSKNCFLTTE